MSYPEITGEIISIGDEITSGAILDTNSQWLSIRLAELGVRVLYHTTVGDELEPMVRAFDEATRRSSVVIVTGGLGPTEDDLTRQAAAKAFGVELVQDRDALEYIKAMFARRKRQMPESNVIQSYFPKGSNVIVNPNGTAPGFVCSGEHREQGHAPWCMLTFPGVPAEMKEMWNDSARDTVATFLESHGGKRHYIKKRYIHCYGAGESAVEERLPHLIRRDHVPTVGITAKLGVITLRILAESDDEKECDRQLKETGALVYEKVGDLVFGENDETLASVVCDKLLALHKCVACIEWGTRGKLTSRLDPNCFSGSWIVSTEKSFNPEELNEMFQTFPCQPPVDYYLVVGPYPESRTDGTGKVTVCVRDARTGRLVRDTTTFGGHPSIIDDVYCNRVLNLLRKML